MTTREPTFDAALDRLQAAFDDPDGIRMAHARAVKALLDADRPLAYRDLADELNLSGRQTRRVIGDLEDSGVIERHEQPRGSTEPDRFGVVRGG